MAQAVRVAKSQSTFLAGAFALGAAAIVGAAVLVVGTDVQAPHMAPAAQPASEAAIQAGRDWQARYEQMSGAALEASRHDRALVEAGREWQRQRELQSVVGADPLTQAGRNWERIYLTMYPQD